MIIPQMTFIFCFGCGATIRQHYAIEREKTMGVLPPIDQNQDWEPDIRLRIGYSRIGDLCQTELQRLITRGSMSREALGVTLEADSFNTVQSVRITDHHIDQRFTIKANIDGHVDWSAGFLSGRLPYSAIFRGRAKIEFEDGRIFATLEEMEGFHIGFKQESRIDFTKHLVDWVDEQVADFGAIELAGIDMEKLDVRAIRVNSSTHTADLELLSKSPQTTILINLNHKPTSDWELQIAQPLAASWIRKASFEENVIRFGMTPDPIWFSMTGSRFDMTLRLWNLSPINAWWRDYKISGNVDIEDDVIKLKHNSVAPIKDSGKGVRDPITALSEGIIIDTITEKLNLTVPNTKAFAGKKGTLTATLTTIRGEKGALLINGTADVDKSEP